MPIIKVEMFKGRTADQKRALAQELTDAFVRTAGGNAGSNNVMITEYDKQDWAKGGQLYSDKPG